MGRVVLVLGGARSGKSEVGEGLVGGPKTPVTYIATGGPPDAVADPSWADRVAAHRARRSPAWTTVEAGADLVDVLRAAAGAVIVDSLGAWVAGVEGFAVDTAGLCAALLERDGHTVVVSDEVGLGVHPPTEVGVAFRDALGDVNRAVAAVADEVLLVVAGRSLPLR